MISQFCNIFLVFTIIFIMGMLLLVLIVSNNISIRFKHSNETWSRYTVINTIYMGLTKFKFQIYIFMGLNFLLYIIFYQG